jgi:hypothetical protein
VQAGAVPARTADPHPEPQRTTHTDPRAARREAKLAELNARLLDVMHRRYAMEDKARQAAHARHQFFDDVTSREDAVQEEGGPALKALQREEWDLEAAVRRLASLSLDELE